MRYQSIQNKLKCLKKINVKTLSEETLAENCNNGRWKNERRERKIVRIVCFSCHKNRMK